MKEKLTIMGLMVSLIIPKYLKGHVSYGVNKHVSTDAKLVTIAPELFGWG